MKIGIIGTGNVGGTLGRRWALSGHHVEFGTRDANSAKMKELLAKAGKNAKAVSVEDAVKNNEIVVLTVPWTAALGIVKSIKNWKGKILVDCTNPLKSDFSGLAIDHNGSAAEEIAKMATGAKVIKAFNTVGSLVMENPNFVDGKAVLLIGGDDLNAKAEISKLAVDLGFDVLDAGGLSSARYMEHFAMLWIHMAFHQKLGNDFAFKLLKR